MASRKQSEKLKTINLRERFHSVGTVFVRVLEIVYLHEKISEQTIANKL